MTKVCSLFKSPIGYITVVNDGFYVTNVIIGNYTSDYQFDQNDKVNNKVISELEEYFTGSRETFDVPIKFEGTEFQKKVWNALTKIPYGETHSYSEVAESIGKPTAIRAIGTATSKNPIAIIVPAHRVVNSSGEVLGYSGGVSIKKRLLDLEKSKVMAVNQKLVHESRLSSEPLDVALKSTDIYEYYYYPQDRLMLFPKRASDNYGLETKYEDAPESFFKAQVYPEDGEQYFGIYNRLMEEGEHSTTAIYRNKDGSKWFRVVLSVTEYVNGKPSMAVGIFTEITNAKMREMEALSIINMHQDVIKAIKDMFIGIHVLDMAKGTIRSLRTMNGLEDYALNAEYDYKQWLTNICQFYHPSDRVRLCYQYSLENIVKRRDLGEHKIHETYRRFTGSSYVWISNCIIINSHQASRNKAIFIQTDVSDRYQKSNILNALGMDYYSLYYINVDDDTYEALYSDEMLKDILNLSDDGRYSELAEKYIDAFVYQDDVAEMSNFTSLANIRKTLGVENRQITHVFRRRTAHNNYEWVQIMYILTITDSSHFVTMALKNVNEKMRKDLNQKQLLQYTLDEAESDKNVKNKFLSKMSSDLRNPMTSIIGLTTLAKANLENPKYLQGCLEQINLLGNDLLSLIDEVLDMSKIENAEFSLNRSEFNFMELVQSILDITLKYFKEKSIDFTCLAEGVTVGKVLGDVAKLQQLLTNLISNEVKYTNVGGKVNFTIKQLRVFDDNVVTFQLIFEDNGMGIQEDELESIFKPFVRSNDSRVQNVAGAGLGLTIASKIVELMDGKIEVESTFNKGSKFTVTFNLLVAERMEAPKKDYSNVNILMVNSKDKELKNLCNTVVSNVDVNITPMYLGVGALNEILAKHRASKGYHAVIIDKNLVDVDYLKLANSIRKIMGRNPIKVFISSYDCNMENSSKLPNTVDGIISKPIFMPYFYAMLDELNTYPLQVGENIFERKPLSGTKALLVSGEEVQVKINQELLKMLGSTVDTKCENIEKIVNSISHNDYDYIVIDTDEITNLENLVKIITLLDSSVPIIAITSCNLQSYLEKLISYGISSHVVKPIDNNIDYLVSTILSNLK